MPKKNYSSGAKGVEKYFDLEAEEVTNSCEEEEDLTSITNSFTSRSSFDEMDTAPDEGSKCDSVDVLDDTDVSTEHVAQRKVLTKSKKKVNDDAVDDEGSKSEEKVDGKAKDMADDIGEEEDVDEAEDDDMLEHDDDDNEEVGLLPVPFKKKHVFLRSGYFVDELPAPSGYFFGTVVQLNEQIAIGPTNQLIKNPYFYCEQTKDYVLRSKGPFEVLASDHYMGYVDGKPGRLLVSTEKWLHCNAKDIKHDWQMDMETPLSWKESEKISTGHGWIETPTGWERWSAKGVPGVPKVTLQKIREWKEDKRKSPPKSTTIQKKVRDSFVGSSRKVSSKRGTASYAPTYNPPSESDSSHASSKKARKITSIVSPPTETKPHVLQGRSDSPSGGSVASVAKPVNLNPQFDASVRRASSPSGSNEQPIPLLVGNPENEGVGTLQQDRTTIITGEFVQGNFFLIRAKYRNSDDHGFVLHLRNAIQNGYQGMFTEGHYKLHPVVACLRSNSNEEAVNTTPVNGVNYRKLLFAVYIHEDHCLKNASEERVTTYLAQIAQFLQGHSFTKERPGVNNEYNTRANYEVGNPCLVHHEPPRKLGNLIKLHEVIHLVAYYLSKKVVLHANLNRELRSILAQFYDEPWNLTIRSQYGFSINDV